MDDARPDKNVYEGAYEGTTYSNTGWYDKFLGDFYDLVDSHKDDSDENMQAYIDGLKQKVYGTNYKLVYFPEEGKPTYDIPANTNIVFFIVKKDSQKHDASLNTNTGGLSYSLPELNERINSKYETFCDKETLTKADGSSPIGSVRACTWQIGDNIYLGFEDGTDIDVNDIVFLVDGDFEHDEDRVVLHDIIWYLNDDPTNPEATIFHQDSKQVGIRYQQPGSNPVNAGKEFLGWAEEPNGTPIESSTTPGTITGTTPEGGKVFYAIWESLTPDPTPDPEYITWMFACEDLGSDFDYDFNDVVWEVRHEVGTSKLEARILAAGGTLPFALQYNGSPVMTKEQAFGTGCNGTVMIKPKPTEWFTVSESVDDDWSVTTNASEFSVLVSQEDGSVVSKIEYAYSKDDEDATNNNKTPQVIIVPYDWLWPKETHKISLAYPGFKTWAANATWAEWSDTIDEEHVVNR